MSERKVFHIPSKRGGGDAVRLGDAEIDEAHQLVKSKDLPGIRGIVAKQASQKPLLSLTPSGERLFVTSGSDATVYHLCPLQPHEWVMDVESYPNHAQRQTLDSLVEFFYSNSPQYRAIFQKGSALASLNRSNIRRALRVYPDRDKLREDPSSLPYQDDPGRSWDAVGESIAGLDKGEAMALRRVLTLCREPADSFKPHVLQKIASLDPETVDRLHETVQRRVDQISRNQTSRVRDRLLRPDRVRLAVRILRTGLAGDRVGASHALFNHILHISEVSEYKNPQLATDIVPSLGDSEPNVRANIAASLGALRYHGAADRLIGLVDDPHSMVSESAMEALGSIGEPKAIPVLERVYSSGDTSARVSAVTSLGLISVPECGRTLVNALVDPEADVVRASTNSLLAVSDPDTAAAVARVGLSHDNPVVREKTAKLLSRLSDRPRLVESLKVFERELLGCLDDGSDNVKSSVKKALTKIQSMD